MILRLSLLVFLLCSEVLHAQEFLWTATSIQHKYELIRSIAKVGPNTLLCGGGTGKLYRSTNDGRHWREISSPAEGENQIRPLKSDDFANVYAVSSDFGLFRSSDLGDSWIELSKTLPDKIFYNDLVIAPNGNLLLSANAIGGFYLSSDDGQTWTMLEEFDRTLVKALILSPRGDLIAGTMNGGLYRSQDNGVTWQILRTGLPNLTLLSSLAVLGKQHLFAAGISNIHRSSDGGDSWTVADLKGELEQEVVYDFADNGLGRYFVCTNEGVYISEDEGQSWRSISKNIAIRDTRALALSPEGHLLAGTESRGIYRSTHPIAVPENFAELAGRVFNDLDDDCLEGTDEAGIAHRLVRVEPGPFYGITDQNGDYVVRLPPGNFTASLLPRRNWRINCKPAERHVALPTAGERLDDLDFAHFMIPGIEEVALSISSEGRPRPGAEITYCIQGRNIGTVEYSGTLDFMFDPLLNFVSASPQPGNLEAGLARFDVEQLPLESTLALKLTLRIPPDPSLTGRRICARVATATSSSDQLLRGENFDEDCLEIRNSFDPNDIQVEPAGTGPQGFVPLSEQILAYTIRFQNTGNAEAIEVRVLDTLDDNLDIASLRMGIVSHDYRLIIRDDNILEFRFDNINLPDNKSDEAGSNGFIKYTIHLKPDMTAGTQIRNRAAIYFDFNAPVITNTVVTTLKSTSTTVDDALNSSGLSIYPNPSGGLFSIASSGDKLLTVRMFDIHGSEIPCTTKTAGKGLIVYSEHSATSVYFLRITGAGGEYVRRIQLFD